MKKFQFIISSVVLGIFLSYGQRGYSQTNSLKKKIPQDYEPAAKKLEAFYTNIRMRGKIVHWWKENNQYIEYMANGPLLRLKSVYDELGEFVSVANNKGSFYLIKKNNGNGFQLREAGNPDLYQDMAQGIRSSAILPFAPFCFNNTTIIDFFKHSNDGLKDVITINREGKTFVKVVFEWPTVPNKPMIMNLIWLIFSPDDCWALHEYYLGAVGVRVADCCLITYENKLDGIPLVKKIERWRVDGEGKHHKELSAEVSEILPGSVPGEEFTLAAFGIPEVAPAVETHRQRFYYILLGGVLLIGLGFLFRYLDKRRKAA